MTRTEDPSRKRQTLHEGRISSMAVPSEPFKAMELDIEALGWNSPLRLPDAARLQVGKILRGIASKYACSDSPREEESSPAPSSVQADLSIAGSTGQIVSDDEHPDESARDSPALGLCGENADGSMRAYARWLAAELAAESAADAEHEPDEPDAAPAGGDAAEAAPAAPPLGAPSPPARVPSAAKRRPLGRRKPMSATAQRAAERAPSQLSSVSVRCAVLVGSEVWAVARDSGSILIYDAASAALLDTVLCLHETIVAMAAAAPRPRSCAPAVWAGTDSGSLLLFDRLGQLLREVTRLHAGAVQAIAVQPAPAAPRGGARAGGLVVTGGSDRRLCVYSSAAGPERGGCYYHGHTGGVRCVLLLGAHVWSGSDDGSVRVWDLAHAVFHLAQAEACVATLRGERGAGVRALLALGPSAVLAASEDGCLSKWQGAPHFACELRVACGGTPTALVPMGRRLWVCCGRAGVEVRDASSLALCDTLGARGGAPAHAAGALRVRAVERRSVWTWVPGEPGAAVWEREEAEGGLCADAYVGALAQADAAAQQLDGHLAALAALRARARADALRALAVSAGLAHELEAAVSLGASRARELSELSERFMAQQEADLEEQRQLHALCEQLEAAHRAQEAEHARALGEAAEREAALRAELREARLQREAAREQLDAHQAQLSAAFCERDLLKLHGSQLQLELRESQGRSGAPQPALFCSASCADGVAASDGEAREPTVLLRPATAAPRSGELGAEARLAPQPQVAEGGE